MPTQCPYCRTVNDRSESRCARCGRRLHDAPPRQGFASTSGAATALALEPQTFAPPAAETRPLASAALASGSPVSAVGQASLFNDLPGGAKILPIPTLTPLRPASPLDRESVRRNAARSAARVTRQPGEKQQALDLRERQARVHTRPDEALFWDAMVAQPQHRAAAAAIDGLLVLIGTALFAGGALLAGVDLGLLGNLLVLPAAMCAVVVVLYRGLWCLANCDTPGMRLAGLRLVDFDGREPRRDRRIVRQFAGVLSLLSAGVGLVWALVDEENLTWHDHISKTFPTAA